MGLNASIIVYPMIEEARDSLLTRIFSGAADEAGIRTFVRSSDQLQAMARRIVTAFERRGFISEGTAASAPVTQGHGASPTRIEFEAPRELLWAHMAVDPRALLPAINAIVYTSTQGEWWGDLQANDNPELLAVPHLDVTLFSTPVTIMDATIAKVVCCTWAVVDFSYEDSRVSKEIHRIRNEADPLFEALAADLGSPMTWRIVPG